VQQSEDLRAAAFSSVNISSNAPLWEKVAIGGPRPQFLRTPMLRIGYAKSATDEGFLSVNTGVSVKDLRLRK